MRTGLSFIGMALALIFLPSCSSVQVKDYQFIGSLGPEGAVQFGTLDNIQTNLTTAEFWGMWNDLTHPMVATSVDTLTDIKAIIEKLCSFENGECQYMTPTEKAQAKQFFNHVDTLKAKAASLFQ